MSDPTKLHRLFGDQNHVNAEARLPVRAVVKDYDGNTAHVYIPAFDGGKTPFPVDYVGADFQPGDLLLVCKDEADTYWIVGMQAVPVVQAKFVSGSNSGGGGGSTLGGGNGALPKNSTLLNEKQRMFAQRLNADIGLEPCVICGWVISEEPASSTCAPNGCNNWLNVGAFDAGGWAGGGADVWSAPVKGADATASFITGKQVNGINSPLHAADSIHAIGHVAGKSIAEQISTIQNSHWASSGYPNLPAAVNQFR